MGMMLRRRTADDASNLTTRESLRADDKTVKKEESNKDEPKAVKRGRKPNH